MNFDQSLLLWAGIAIIIIIILLACIAFLISFIRRRSRPKRQVEPTTPSMPVVAQTNQAATPTIPSNPSAKPVEDLATVPSNRVQAKDPAATLPSVQYDDGLVIRPVSDERPANINWQIAGLTHVGRKRELNEDNLLLIEAGMSDLGVSGLYIVADGMGGHESGELASRLTIDTIHEHFRQQPPTPQQAPFEEWLKSAIMSANETVIAHQQDGNEPKKMGATLVMAFVNNNQAHIANVGDSRAYHLTAETISQISVDHSLVERLIEIGQITREEARTHKQRNVVYSTVGDKAKMQIGYYHVDLQPGDRLLLCSDGLSGMLTDEQIFNISRDQTSPTKACEMLIRAANAAGGEDNITAIMIEMDE